MSGIYPKISIIFTGEARAGVKVGGAIGKKWKIDAGPLSGSVAFGWAK